MTSQVNPNNIDGTYPVAGQDNDSQGFRDNFTNIRNNFTYIKSEVEDLQNKAVLKSALTNTTLDNSLLGNAIVGASLTQWRENFNDIGSVSGSITVDFTNGNFQKITMNGSTTLAFSFPSNTSGQYASVKLWVHVETAAYTLTLPDIVTLGDPDTIAGLAGTSPPIITFNSAELANSTDFFFEFYTFNSGTTIGIKDLTRNRDVDLSGMSITGNLSLDGLTVSTYNSSFGSNLTITGNIITAGGRINSNFAYITLTNDQNYFANISYQTLYFDTASSATIANARIALPGTAVDGREINMSFLAPITALWVNSGNTALVKWLPNASVSSGNVSVKFVYSTGAGTWLKSA